MSDYSHLSKLAITEETLREYVFDDIVIGRNDDDTFKCPSVWCAAALDSNKAFKNERHRIATEKVEQYKDETKAQRKKRLMSVDADEEQREFEISLFSVACVKRWGDVGLPAVDGEVHELNPTETANFLRSLAKEAPHIYGPFAAWLQNPYNFFERTALLPENIETLGNS